MKVVLFCGGLGTRIREYPEPVPKPMITIGYRPILWHVMKYYAHYGHKDFILCLGYKADAVKNYFLNYDECVSNNFVLSNGGKKLQLMNSDIHDWNITFVDTGISSNIGQRLKAVEPYLKGESMFLANYSDGLTDLPLPEYIDHFLQRGKVGSFLAVRPPRATTSSSFDGDLVKGIQPISKAGIWINGGFFVFRHGDLRLHGGRGGTRRRALPAADPGGTAARATGTTDSGRAWTPSRTSSSSTTCIPGARHRGRSGSTTRESRMSAPWERVGIDEAEGPDHQCLTSV